MTEYYFGEIIIKPFDLERDGETVKGIVGEIWGGGFPALIEKEYGLIGGRPWKDSFSESILEYFQTDGIESFVAEKEDTVIGFCSYQIDNAQKIGTVGYNGVALSHQGKKIGSAMLDFVMSQIRTAGMEYAAVLVADNEEHIPALRNYEKHGFQRITGYHHMFQKL